MYKAGLYQSTWNQVYWSRRSISNLTVGPAYSPKWVESSRLSGQPAKEVLRDLHICVYRSASPEFTKLKWSDHLDTYNY